jgi:hypothetical protein
MDLANRVPAEHRNDLLQIAEQLLTLAGDKITEKSDAQQNATTTGRSQ